MLRRYFSGNRIPGVKEPKKRLKPGPKPRPSEKIRETVSIRFDAGELALIDDAAGPEKGARSDLIRSAALDRARRKLKARE